MYSAALSAIASSFSFFDSSSPASTPAPSDMMASDSVSPLTGATPKPTEQQKPMGDVSIYDDPGQDAEQNGVRSPLEGGQMNEEGRQDDTDSRMETETTVSIEGNFENLSFDDIGRGAV